MTRDDRLVELIELESRCPDCGETFSTKATKGNVRRRMLTRRCPDCQRPGVPVAPLAKPVASEARRKSRKAAARRRTRTLPTARLPAPATQRDPPSAAIEAVNVRQPETQKSTPIATAAPATVVASERHAERLAFESTFDVYVRLLGLAE